MVSYCEFYLTYNMQLSRRYRIMLVRGGGDYPTVSRPMTNPMPNINKRRTVLQVWQIWPRTRSRSSMDLSASLLRIGLGMGGILSGI
jgi:hypothetical protein